MKFDPQQLVANLYLEHQLQAKLMDITPEIETYFLSFTLIFGIDGTPPPRTVEGDTQRYLLHLKVSRDMMSWNHRPDFVKKLMRAYAEAGTDNTAWFYGQLADAYIRWLHTARTPRPTPSPEKK